MPFAKSTGLSGHRWFLRGVWLQLVSQTPIARLIAGVLLCQAALGCGGTLYGAKANVASSRLEEARELGAEELAPYEYYSALQFYEKAQEEAASAQYGDAVALAERSARFSDKAIRLLSQTTQRSANP